VPAHSTAVGKVLLADRPDAAAILERTGMPRRTDRTITSVSEMLAELERVRERGYALDLGEEETGVHCLAVPVRDGQRVVAGMSVSGPADRMKALDLAELARGMRKIADDFGADVFGSPAAAG
jgi:IclR family acetate operon transcriptional repressor